MNIRHSFWCLYITDVFCYAVEVSWANCILTKISFYPYNWNTFTDYHTCPKISPSIFYYLIMKTYLYNFDPIKPHFYIVKLRFIGVFILFSYFCSKAYIVSIRYPQSMLLSRNMKKYKNFLSENFHFFIGGKISVYLKRRVFVMCWFV